jgi:hypothetical protein
MEIVVACLKDTTNRLSRSVYKVFLSDRLQRLKPTLITRKFVTVTVEKFTFARIPAERCDF